MATELWSLVKIVLETPARDEADAAVDAVVAVLGEPGARRFPVEEYPKFPDCWKGIVHLPPVVDDPPAVVAEVSAKLAAGGWVLKDRSSDAIAVWDRRNTALIPPGTVLAHPAVAWVLIEASPPPVPEDDLPEPEELVLEEPEYGWGGMDDDDDWNDGARSDERGGP